ncbi:Apolipoprotein(a) (Fragment) [Seminavis robusta]|uniref:Apolipoprotein(A) n=1 Tax=Seminavis robusta TaxID=568900 RepID=A0A9N8EA35_9STRA
MDRRRNGGRMLDASERSDATDMLEILADFNAARNGYAAGAAIEAETETEEGEKAATEEKTAAGSSKKDPKASKEKAKASNGSKDAKVPSEKTAKSVQATGTEKVKAQDVKEKVTPVGLSRAMDMEDMLRAKQVMSTQVPRGQAEKATPVGLSRAMDMEDMLRAKQVMSTQVPLVQEEKVISVGLSRAMDAEDLLRAKQVLSAQGPKEQALVVTAGTPIKQRTVSVAAPSGGDAPSPQCEVDMGFIGETMIVSTFRNSSATQTSQVGAVHVTPSGGPPRNDIEIGMDGELSNDSMHSMISRDSIGGITTATVSLDGMPLAPDDTLANATLVDDEEVVEARKAPEGFKAIVANKRFGYLVAGMVIVLLVVIIPVAVVVPRNKGTATVITANATFFECGTALKNQADYRGTINVTSSGVLCQRWDSQFPNSHAFLPEEYPEADLSENYCRNPDGEARPFCIAAVPGLSQKVFCSVPYCDGEIRVDNTLCGTLKGREQSDYRGTINTTMTGKPCQRWDSQLPHHHPYSPDMYPLAGLESNYCRNPDSESAAWCYTTDNKTRWEFCDVPFCEVVYYNGTESDAGSDVPVAEEESGGNNKEVCGSPLINQADYRGNVNHTESGRTCQRWDSQLPQRHSVTPENYPDLGLEENYCRNPDGEPRAWCYTTDEEKRWEFCDIPDCDSADKKLCGTYDGKQQDYMGMINVTKSGLACQRWDTQEPHYHYEHPALMPNKNLIGNACRNPTSDERAWCYTQDPNVIWEYCDVPFCMSEEARERSMVCGSREERQADYRGTVAVTESGRRCQHWGTDFPHKNAPDPAKANMLQENYCRNPDGLSRAWCYTTDPTVRNEFCNIPYCEDMEAEEDEGLLEVNLLECGSQDLQQADYRGFVNETAGGIACQAWSAQTPHEHGLAPEDHPDSGLSGNFCRNPDGEPRAWCYTVDPEKRWDFCDISYCEDMEPEEDDEEEGLLEQVLCANCTSFECGSPDILQADYRGFVNETVGGIACQAWSAQTPHEHGLAPEDHPDSGLSGNFCRNPDGEPRAWCYTVDPEKRWDFCSVPICA